MSGAEDWDERYREDGESIWSGRPNGALIAEVAGLTPGNATDLGCGEGADAIWLAKQGWRVTGVDISQVALDRAAKAGREADVTVDWIRANFVEQPLSPGAFDLVTTHYPALLKSHTDEAIHALVIGVAPGGTLLFVSHDTSDPEVAESHGFDPDNYLEPTDLADHLDSDWVIEVLETRERASPSSDRSPHSEDVVLRATRRS